MRCRLFEDAFIDVVQLFRVAFPALPGNVSHDNEEKQMNVYICAVLMLFSAAVYPSGRYRDIFIGNKAAGLGGAFIGVADDNNAVWHNPAGMAWMQGVCVGTSPSFELHANARGGSFLNEDEAESSVLFVPASLSSVSDAGPGKLGLGVFMPVKEAFTQNTSAGPVTAGSDTWSGFLDRTENEEIFYLGAAYAGRINDYFSIGGALYYVSAHYSHDLYQLIYDPSGVELDYYETELKESEKLRGFTAEAGAMFRPSEHVSLGLVLRTRTRLQGDGLYREVHTEVNPFGVVVQPRTVVFNTDVDQRIIPASLGLGVSWQINDEWMIAADLVRYFSAEYERYDHEEIHLEPVTNVSIGAEWRITEHVPFRFGVYTNNSYFPEIDGRDEPQKPHVDVQGIVAGAGYESDQNTFFGCLKIGSGEGKEKVRDQITGVYTSVDAVSYTFGFILGMNYSF